MNSSTGFSTTKKVFDNGMRVIFHEMPWAESTTALLWVGAGPCYESKEISGAAHFLEHMFFEGTQKYPNNRELTKAIEFDGGDVDAYTQREYVSYQAKFPNDNSKKSISFLYEVLFNSLLHEDVIEKEKSIIIQELHRRIDDLESERWDQLAKCIWSEHHPLGRRVVGSEESIKNMNRHVLVSYHKHYYIPSNMTLVVAGNFNQQDIIEGIKSSFGALKNSSQKPAYVSPDSKYQPNNGHKTCLIKKEKVNQAYLALSYQLSLSHRDKKFREAQLLNSILSKEIFDGFVYKLGISYTAFAYLWPFRDQKVEVLIADVALTKLTQAAEKLKDILHSLVLNSSSITEGKNRLKKSLFLDLADTNDLADFIMEQDFFTGEVKSPKQIKEEIDSINEPALEIIRKKIIGSKNSVVMVMGNIDKSQETKVNKILSS